MNHITLLLLMLAVIGIGFMGGFFYWKGKNTRFLLYTFFFGYAPFKWRRLIRTLILIPSVGGLISGIVAGFLEELSITIATIGIFSGVSLVIGLISWLIKPFVVKED
jgi:hypothetical protein|tara:strand:+ start:414 stop:734 length:321 start_codon:yes stop_codon:yes gene_type:complete